MLIGIDKEALLPDLKKYAPDARLFLFYSAFVL